MEETKRFRVAVNCKRVFRRPKNYVKYHVARACVQTLSRVQRIRVGLELSGESVPISNLNGR